MSEEAARLAIVRVAARLDAKEILTATDGNISVRLAGGEIVITPSGTCKGLLDPDDLVVIEPSGTVRGSGRPSLELALHRAVYAARPDIFAVVHAHPAFATAYAVAGIPLDRPILSEFVLTLSTVPVAPYATPTREALARSIEPFVGNHDAILLAHHGAMTFATTIEKAGHLMETLEHVAKVDYLTRTLGSLAELPAEAVAELEQIRDSMKL